MEKKIRQASFLRYKKETQFGGQKKMANGNGRTTYCTIAHAFTYLSGEWKWNKAMKNQMEKNNNTSTNSQQNLQIKLYVANGN